MDNQWAPTANVILVVQIPEGIQVQSLTNVHQVCSGVIRLYLAQQPALMLFAQVKLHAQLLCALMEIHVQLLPVLLLDWALVLQHNLSAHLLCQFSTRQYACVILPLVLQQVE
jgi:hypothetical protein